MLNNDNNIEYIVLIKNILATFVILFTTLLPSINTSLSTLKSEFNNTICETCLATSEASGNVILQSACFNATTSLTPSPVIATEWPFSWSAFTIKLFWCGITLAKTLYLSTNSGISSSELIVDKSIYESYDSKPAFFAILETVNGLSPEIIFISTACVLKKPNISFAFFLNGSSKVIAATISSFGRFSSLTISFE